MKRWYSLLTIDASARGGEGARDNGRVRGIEREREREREKERLGEAEEAGDETLVALDLLPFSPPPTISSVSCT